MCCEEIIVPTLLLKIKQEAICYFYPLLQQGVKIRMQVGSSIRDMLCEELKIPLDYVEEQIKTIFLDGKPVDDLASARIKDGTIVALSAAMPGLVGATFRRGGHLALFRSTITHEKEETSMIQDQEGFVTLKFFNLLVRDLGANLLKQGVWLKGDELENFLNGLPEKFWTECQDVQLNKKRMEADSLIEKNLFDSDKLIRIFIISNES